MGEGKGGGGGGQEEQNIIETETETETDVLFLDACLRQRVHVWEGLCGTLNPTLNPWGGTETRGFRFFCSRELTESELPV